MASPTPDLERRGRRLEYLTVGWNVIEAVVAVAAGVAAKSIALIGFGLDSTVEIFAACVVIWQLRGTREEREERALRLIAISFYALAAYVAVEAARDLAIGAEAGESVVGIGRRGRSTRRGAPRPRRSLAKKDRGRFCRAGPPSPAPPCHYGYAQDAFRTEPCIRHLLHPTVTLTVPTDE